MIAKDPGRFQGVTVEVSAILYHTAHSILLYDEQCPRDNLVWEFPYDLSEPSVHALHEAVSRADQLNIDRADWTSGYQSVNANVIGKIAFEKHFDNDPLGGVIVPFQAYDIGIRPAQDWVDLICPNCFLEKE